MAQDRQKRKKRSKSKALAVQSARPARFEHGESSRYSRRTMVKILLVVIAVALVIPTFIIINVVRDSVPNPVTDGPGGKARLVTETTLQR